MKLIQLNAWGGRLERQIDHFIKTESPDILCLEEATSFNEVGLGLFITLEQLQKYNLANIAFAPVFSFSYMSGTARFGNAILSRLPITKTEIVFTNLEHKEDFVFGEDHNNVRNFVHAIIKINGSLCNVIAHHGYWIPEHKNGNEETLSQMKIILDYINDLEGPVILAGDFNLAPRSKSIGLLNESLINLPATHKLKTTRTSLTHKTEVCDYIFVSDQVKVKNFYAADELVSDHKALVLEFDL